MSRFAGVAVLVLLNSCASAPPLTQVGIRQESEPRQNLLGCVMPGIHVEIVNKGNERLLVSWASRNTPPVNFRIGEAGLGTTYLKVADHVLEHVSTKPGYFAAQYARQDFNYQTRPNNFTNYTMRLVCTESVDPSKR